MERLVSRVPVRRALISVSDKSGLTTFASRLIAAGVDLVSSGGTAAAIMAAGLPVTAVESITGAPEMFGGRLQTLHPKIHGGILADTRQSDHLADLAAHGIETFDLVVVNLYPFEAAIAASGVTSAEAIENIDIGGPAMIRAAAKNHERVGVVVDPRQYDEVSRAVEQGGLDADLKEHLAREAFFRTAAYDAAIVGWMGRGPTLPELLVVPLRKRLDLRYGENPHQEGAAYSSVDADAWWADAEQLQGKQMSFNNYLDTEAAWRLVHEFDKPAAAVIKHSNPAGVAVAAAPADAFAAAWDCDPVSAFGGVIALNRALDSETASRIVAAGFVEVIAAPGIDDEATGLLADKPNIRVLVAGPPQADDLDFRGIEGGFVIQERDHGSGRNVWKVVTDRAPSKSEAEDLAFAWKVAAHTKSNAIVVAKDGAAIGVGAGDQSRVGAAERAVSRAGSRARGAVAASDAFFPFRDGIDALAAAGITAIVEPGGSIRDNEVIAAADDHGIAMVFTETRHFLH